MEAFLISTLAVGIAEIGDKTLFLAIILAVRYQRPWPIFWGMALAIFANHALAAVAGVWVATLVGDHWLHWLVGIGFIAMAAWVLVPEHPDAGLETRRGSAFITSLAAFFLMEFGDKTQLVTVAMAAHFNTLIPVILGSTVGVLLANAPALWFGHTFAVRLPLHAIRWAAASLFLVLGTWILLETAGWLPEWQLFDREGLMPTAETSPRTVMEEVPLGEDS